MTDDTEKLWQEYDAWWDVLSPEEREHVEKCCEAGRTDDRLRAMVIDNDGPSKPAFEVGSELTGNDSKYFAIPSALVEYVETKR